MLCSLGEQCAGEPMSIDATLITITYACFFATQDMSYERLV